jgi:hypothetical protein
MGFVAGRTAAGSKARERTLHRRGTTAKVRNDLSEE